ncbi:MAG TPA: histidinol-phosphate transaminase [Actinomycetaceae bacterium]|nr:histidinol-phosphate transaminase [Actinomycetaceae bacterium]
MSSAFRLREDLDSLPAYVPGARPTEGRRVYKLSSNENAFPPLPAVLAAVTQATAELNRYPDLLATEVAEAIADHLAVTADRVVVGNGSVAVLETLLLATCRPGDDVVYAWRSFEAYPIAIQLTGATGVPVPVTGEGRHDLPAMAAALTPATRAVLLCSPNNPTGTVIHHDELRDFLARVPRDVLVVLDEAYIDFVTDPEAARGLDLLADHPNLVVLRTFSKAHGLAGLRVGFALADPTVVPGLRSASTPFGVNAPAQAAAIAALRVSRDIAEHAARVVAKRDAITAELRSMGWQVPQAQGNFYWLPLGDDAADFAAAAAEAGAIVRAFQGDGVRVTVGEDDGNAIVRDVAARWLEQGR